MGTQAKVDVDGSPAGDEGLNIDIIRGAHKRISPHIHRTPVLTCSSFMVNRGPYEVFLKCENFQKIGAFKIRGALNATAQLPEQIKAVTAHSSGNHAQAVAQACKVYGKRAILVMPKDSPICKLNAVKETYGAEIRLCEPNQAAREAMCDSVIKETGAELLHPYDNSRVCAGQGTVALEFLEECPDLDVLVVAVGGGGLLAGCAVAAKAIARERGRCIKVVAAEPAESNDCWRSYQRGWPDVEKREKNEKPPKTIADSVKTDTGEFTYPYLKTHVDMVIQCSEAEIRAAMRLTLERSKLVIEPGAAVAVAAACISPEIPRVFPDAKRVGIVLCGGNVDLDGIPSLI